MATKHSARELECRAALLKLLKPGDKVYGIVKHVSQSGMSRRIGFHAFRYNRKLRTVEHVYLTGYMAGLFGQKHNNDGTITVSGCGMDMIFDCIYNMGRMLWPNGNGRYTRNRNGDTGPETDGGYLLNYGQL